MIVAKLRERNQALDCRVHARAARDIVTRSDEIGLISPTLPSAGNRHRRASNETGTEACPLVGVVGEEGQSLFKSGDVPPIAVVFPLSLGTVRNWILRQVAFVLPALFGNVQP